MQIQTRKSNDSPEKSKSIEEIEHLMENTDDPDSPSLTRVPPLHLDEIFDRIGFGRYQLRLMIILGLVAATEGAQVIIGFLSFTILQNQREYSNTIQSFLITLNFIGVLAGGAAAGFFADRFGRLRPILTALTLITILNFLSGLVYEVAMFGLIRFLLGLFLGFSAPIGFTIVVENMPKVHRGKLVMMATACLFIGQLIGCILAFLTVPNLISGDHRSLVLWSTVFMFLVLVLNYVYLRESIRYQLVMGHHEEAFKELDNVVKFNKKEGSAPLTKEEKDGLIEWAWELSVEIPNQEIGNFKTLFRKQYRKTTLLIWLGYFIFSIVYYGLVLSLPYMLQRISQESGDVLFYPIYNSTDLRNITLSVLMESVSVVIAIFVADTVNVERAKMIRGFFFVAAVASVGAMVGGSRRSFIICATFAKICINICSCFYYLITVEAYPTKCRAMGTGLATAVGKIGTIIMPWVFLPLAARFLRAPFILFVCLSLIGFASTFWFPPVKKGADLK